MSDEAELIDEAEEFRAYPKSVQPGIPTLGDIPKGWRVLPIGKLLKVVQRPVKMADDEVYQLVTARRNRGGVVARERLTGAKIATKTQFRVKAGDFVMSRRQIAHGACGILPADLNDALVSNEYAALLPTDQLDEGFLQQLPHSIYFQQTCFHSSIGVHVEKLVFNLDHWLTWPILVPSTAEQRRIAAVLDGWDAAITTAERLVAAIKRRNQALSRRIFPKGEPLESNATFTVSQLSTVIRGVSYDPSIDVDGDIPILTASHIQNGRVGFTALSVRVREMAVDVAQLIRTGDIAICMSNGSKHLVGKAARVLDEPPRAAFGAFCATCRPISDSSGRLLAHALQSDRYRELLHVELAGSAIGNLAPSALGLFRFSWTGNETDLDVLDIANSELESASDLLTGLRQQKVGIMQQLLTGKSRVPETVDALLPPAPRLVAAA